MAGKEVDLATALNRRATHKDFKEVIRLAYGYGWTGHLKSSGGLELMAPDRGMNVYVPNNTKNTSTVARTLRQRVLRWAALQHVDPSIDGVDPSAFDDVEFTVSAPGTKGTSARCNEHDVEFMSWDALSLHIRTEHPTITEEDIEVVKAEDSEPEEAETPPAMSTTMSTEVERRPWLAQAHKMAGGETLVYESETVVEVWDGGVFTAFECAFEGCNYMSVKNPRSVSTHYGKKHVEQGEAQKVAKPVLVPSGEKWEPKYSDSMRLRDSIGSDIYQAMRTRSRHRNETDSKYAAALAEIIVRTRVEAGMPTTWEVTPEETSVLDQIKALLGVTDRQEEITSLEAQLEEARGREAAAKAEAKKVRDTLRTMAELATEESSGQE